MNWVVRLVLQGVVLVLVIAFGVLFGYNPHVDAGSGNQAVCASIVEGALSDDSTTPEGVKDTKNGDLTSIARECDVQRDFMLGVTVVLAIPMSVLITVLILRPAAPSEPKTPKRRRTDV